MVLAYAMDGMDALDPQNKLAQTKVVPAEDAGRIGNPVTWVSRLNLPPGCNDWWKG